MTRRTYVFINRVYPPVAGATGELLCELAEGLAAGGARVVVVTGGNGERRPETGDQRLETIDFRPKTAACKPTPTAPPVHRLQSPVSSL